jgi:NAD(P)-dependent dehydrogenase (short-subunit alcohol dehydrogenase family)
LYVSWLRVISRACGILGAVSMMAQGERAVGKTTFDFAGQVVAVTGGGKGIGKGAAIAFGEAGARVYVIDHTEVTGATTAKVIRERGGQATFLWCDVTSSPNVTAVFERVGAEAGRLDVLVNSAGGFKQQLSVEDTPEDEWDAVVTLNLRTPASPPYSASKAGVHALTRVLAFELGKHSVSVNTVVPGTTVRRSP